MINVHSRRRHVGDEPLRGAIKRRRALRALIAGTAITVGVLAGAGPAPADIPPRTRTVGCARTVELQPLQFPTAAGPRRSSSVLLPDDGGALPPTVAVSETRQSDTDELDLVIGTGENATVRALYLAPAGCAIDWNHDVHPVADPAGRRSVHIPAFTVRLIPLSVPACPGCLRPV